MTAERNPEIRKAVDTLYELSTTENVRAEYEMRLKAQRDRLSQIEGCYQEGKQEGERKGRLDVALKLKAIGLSNEQIMAATGLSATEIGQI